MRVSVKIDAGRTDWVQLTPGMVLDVDTSKGSCKVWFRGSRSEEPSGVKVIAAGVASTVFGPFSYHQGYQLDAVSGPVTYIERVAGRVAVATGDLYTVTLTQAEYDALAVKDSRTIYNITA